MLRPSNIKQPTKIPDNIQIKKCPPGVAAGIVPGDSSTDSNNGDATIADIINEPLTDVDPRFPQIE